MKPWIQAARLRTLPLAACGMLTGISLAHFAYPESSVLTIVLLFSTAVLLQILSNFANDYGDFTKGTDNAARIGPERALQSGSIKAPQMKRALYITGVITFISGTALILTSLAMEFIWYILGFLLLGIASIAAAIRYTVGKSAYGYRGLGDIFVFIFFGWVSVLGSYFLLTGAIQWNLLLPASAIGLFSAGVLHMNNMRDVENDTASGKKTWATHLTLSQGKLHQTLLITTGMACWMLYLFQISDNPNIFWLGFAFTPFGIHLALLWKVQDRKRFDGHLKFVVFASLLSTVAIALYLWL